MLESTQELKQMGLDFDFTYCLVYTEELKNFPYSDVWSYFCIINKVRFDATCEKKFDTMKLEF